MQRAELGSVAAVVRRGDGIDAWHAASVAVVDRSERLVASFGDPELSPLTRSSIKPFQAAVLVESGAADAFDVSPEELAIASASHSGTDEHVAVVTRLLDRAGADPSCLRCGTQVPLHWKLNERTVLSGEDRDPLRHNCSGKHAGFLLVSRFLGEPLSDYLNASSATQRHVRRTLAASCGVPEHAMAGGIDGCSAPNFALPLSALARGMLRLARAESNASPLDRALARIRDAMLRHPLLISGEKRLDYAVMSAFPHNVLSKAGAEAIQAFGFIDPPLGIAIKIHDGSARALPPVCVAVLSQLGLLSTQLPEALAHYERLLIKNYSGLTTSSVEATLKLWRG